MATPEQQGSSGLSGDYLKLYHTEDNPPTAQEVAESARQAKLDGQPGDPNTTNLFQKLAGGNANP